MVEGQAEPKEVSHVEEAEEISRLVLQAGNLDGAEAQTIYQRFRQILEKYQEQSQLLDPHLPDIISGLSQPLRTQTSRPVNATSVSIVQALCRLLWVVASVRGAGVVLKLFPNEAHDLEPVTHLLLKLDSPTDPDGSASDGIDSSHSFGSLWEARCILLLWLAQLVLIPFDLALVDSSLSHGAARDTTTPPLVMQLIVWCQGRLSAPGKERDMAALLLGRLLPRPDMQQALAGFVAWAHEAVAGGRGPEAAFVLPGVAAAVAEIFQQGHRAQLLAIAPQAWQLALDLLASDSAQKSVVARKLAVKLVQRIGLAHLPPRTPSWRYHAPSTSLETSLGAPSASSHASNAAIASAAQAGGGVADSKDRREADASEPDEDEDVDVPEEVEEVIGKLLEALGDKDTVVRWSAAKGLGRITARLPKEFGDEVASSILSVFEGVSASETTWHGGCLALAELARRGLLLPPRLPSTAGIVEKGLLYDVRRGTHSVGANVRDAAAYVCWACARAYAPATLAPFLLRLAPTLLVAACCDREVNCRRAAAAAFQESVGRQDNFPHGIEILTAADYFTLSTRNQAYLSVAPYIATFAEYRTPLVEHLLQDKLRHWEKALRELAARALGALVPTDAHMFAGLYVGQLLQLSLDGSLEVHHGAVLGLAEVILALHAHGQSQHARSHQTSQSAQLLSQHEGQLTKQQQLEVAQLLQKLQDAKFLRGKGGEVMKAATCRLLECMALIYIPLTPAQCDSAHDLLDDCLISSADDIRMAAVSALSAFSRSYLAPQLLHGADAIALEAQAAKPAAPSPHLHSIHPVIERSTRKYTGSMAEQLPAPVRRGSAAALGVLPRGLLLPMRGAVLHALAAATKVEEDAVQRDAATRAEAVSSLASVARELFDGSSHADSPAQGHLAAPGGSPHAPALPPAAAPGALHSQQEPAAQPVQSEGHNESSLRADPDKAEAVLRGSVFEPLLAAMGDYSTDNRGDVGSWVREAAMGALTHTLLLLLRILPAVDSPSTGMLVLAIVCTLAKQSVERIGRVRGTAATNLGILLSHKPPVPHIPAPDLLQAAVAEAVGEASASSEGLAARVGLLQVGGPVREAVLEGLVASIGGLDGSLSQAASSALIAWLQPPGLASGVATIGELEEPVGEAQARLEGVAAALLSIWDRNAQSPRLALPLLRTADLLFSRAHLDQLPGPYIGRLLEAVVQGTRSCRDVPRLCAAAGVLSQMLSTSGDESASAGVMAATLKLLCCPFPKVRKHVAEQLYMALLEVDPEQPAFLEADLEEAQEVLAGVAWDGPLAAVRDAASQLRSALHVAPA